MTCLNHIVQTCLDFRTSEFCMEVARGSQSSRLCTAATLSEWCDLESPWRILMNWPHITAVPDAPHCTTMGVDLFCRNCLVNGGSVDHCQDHFQVVSKVPATKRWISPQRDASHNVSRWDEPVPGVSKKTLCGVTHNYYIAIFGCFVLFHIVLLTTFLNLEELTFKNEIWW